MVAPQATAHMAASSYSKWVTACDTAAMGVGQSWQQCQLLSPHSNYYRKLATGEK